MMRREGAGRDGGRRGGCFAKLFIFQLDLSMLLPGLFFLFNT
jgi:hypothetical protein